MSVLLQPHFYFCLVKIATREYLSFIVLGNATRTHASSAWLEWANEVTWKLSPFPKGIRAKDTPLACYFLKNNYQAMLHARFHYPSG